MFVVTLALLPIVTSLRLSEPELCAGSGSPCDGNECCPGFEGSHSLTFPCPNAQEGFIGCQTSHKYNYTTETLSEAAHVPCPGSCNMCSGEQCCPGFADSNNLTFPCPTASATYDMCESDIRLTDSSACEQSAPVSAIGDPHVTSVTGEKFDLWKTGWSRFVQIPKDIQSNSLPKLLVTGNVVPYGVDKCAPAFLQNVKLSGAMVDGHELLVRAGPLDGAVPFGVSVDGSDFKPIGTLSGSEMFTGSSFSLIGVVSDDEPGVWGPDAKLQMKAGAIKVTIKQHTEGVSPESRSMLDLSVDGLDGVDSVGGWLGVDGAFAAGSAPPECVDVALIASGARLTHHDLPRSVGFQSPRSN